MAADKPFFDPSKRRNNAQQAFKLRKKKRNRHKLTSSEQEWLRRYEAHCQLPGRPTKEAKAAAAAAGGDPELEGAARAGAAKAAAASSEADADGSVPGLDVDGFIKGVFTVTREEASADGGGGGDAHQAGVDADGYSLDPHEMLRQVATGIIALSHTLPPKWPRVPQSYMDKIFIPAGDFLIRKHLADSQLPIDPETQAALGVGAPIAYVGIGKGLQWWEERKLEKEREAAEAAERAHRGATSAASSGERVVNIDEARR